ncbi:MAG: hypothetical protein M5U26_00645 [Planctomycetota bacterium]|nr:hypothetical protein [Planctomycetota bacterium]
MPRAQLPALLLLALVCSAARGEEAKKEEAQAEAASPRLGEYRILSYGRVGSPPLALGTLVLEKDGVYRVLLPGGKESGTGHYAYDAASKTVTWKDGPYKDVFGGEFSIDREGKTHKIRLKSTTIATNSTE